jgi:hypothetical protein
LLILTATSTYLALLVSVQAALTAGGRITGSLTDIIHTAMSLPLTYSRSLLITCDRNDARREICSLQLNTSSPRGSRRDCQNDKGKK